MPILKKIFNFLSSVKLAIPTMLALLAGSVAGTLFESKYNAEFASLRIYKTWWFLAILISLFINISFSTLSRLPWKKRHLGFLITHLGMLMLLVGSVLTMKIGIDGTLQIMEGSDSNLVFLQNNVLEIDRKSIPVTKHLETYDIASDKAINSTNYKFVSYLPFVDVPDQSFDRGTNLNFKIKSPFFDVVQVLNDELGKEVSMGPAQFRIVAAEAPAPVIAEVKKSKKAKKESSSASKKTDTLIIKSGAGQEVASFDISKKKKFSHEGMNIEIIQKFKNAQIVGNKIQDGDPQGNNPALELKITKDGKELREILYQNIPEFSLNPNGIFNFKFSMQGPAGSTSPAPASEVPAAPMMGGAPSSGSGDRMKNTVEFKIVDREKNIVQIDLYKENKLLDTKILNKEEKYVTPWMGIELTFKGLTNASDPILPTPTEPKRKMPLPPSAMLMKYGNNQERWVIENSEMQVNDGTNTTNIYYGRERLFLPFRLYLERFEKKDYPGSEMAMNYRSFVKINSQGETKEIYMNEPLKYDGYTIYQSSYQLTPGQPAVTVLSVNKDPGRFLKYFGSIVMCFGIIFFTFQKSKRFAKFLN